MGGNPSFDALDGDARKWYPALCWSPTGLQPTNKGGIIMLKRLTSRINRTLALTLAAALAVTTAFAGEETDYEKSVVINGRTWTFQSWDWDIESTEGIRVSGVSPATGDIVIPSSAVIDGFEYDVVGIIGTWQEGEDEEGQIIGAFENCTEMTSLTIPASITEIGDRQFLGCTGLKKFIVDPDNEYYASTSDGLLLGYAWSDSGMVKNGRLVTVPASLSSVTIPNSVIMIEGGAFAGCSKLKSITIPNSVTTIYDDAFMDCTGLTGTFTIPSSVTMIDGSAFRGCFGITAFAVESGNPCYTAVSGVLMSQDGDTIAVEAVPKGRTSYTVPAGVTQIGYGAFWDSKLETISLPEGLVFISDYAFKGCSKLKSISLPSTVESFGFGTFAKCTALTSFTIPRDLSWFGHGAFSGCTNLKSFTVEEGNETYSADAGLLMSADGSSVMTVPCGMESVIIPEGVTFIDWQAALNCNLTTLSLPESLTSIDGFSFRGCKNLKSVRVPDNVEYIGWMAFANCTSLKSVSLPSTINEEWLYDEEIFYGCPDDLKIVFRSAPQYTLSANPRGGVLSGRNFGAADGKNTMGKVKVTVGSTEYNTLGVARKSGYTFIGWFTAITGGVQVFDANGGYMLGDYWNEVGEWLYRGNLTVYAQWAKEYAITFYPNGSGATLSGKVFGDADGQSKTAKVKVVKGFKDNNEVGVAKRPGYTFMGWYNDRSAGVRAFDAAGVFRSGRYWSADGLWKMEEDVKVYAQWKPITRKLKFYPNGGDNAKLSGEVFGDADGKNKTAVLTVTYDSTENSVVGKARRAGYYFQGWYTARTGGTRIYDSNGKAIAGNYWKAVSGGKVWQAKSTTELPLYAQWKKASSAAAPEIVPAALAVTAPTCVESATVDGVAYLPDGESIPVDVNVDADGFAVVELDDAVFCGYVVDGVGELFSGDRKLWLVVSP